MDDLSVVIVNYNSTAVIESCLRPLAHITRIIVVDNASTDDSVEQIRQACADADIILNSQNLGYGTAVNQGFARVKTPYALLINPDAVLLPEAVKSLIAAAKTDVIRRHAPIAGGKQGRDHLAIKIAPGRFAV